MKHFKPVLWIMILIFTAGACHRGDHSQKAAVKQAEKLKIDRYGKALFALDPTDLKAGLDSLGGEFHFFIGDNPDTLQVIQIRNFIMNPFNRELASKCQVVYPDLDFLEEGLTGLFGNIKAVDSSFIVPKVYTYVSGLLYESPVQYDDSVLIIGLDMFLGWNYTGYREAGLPVYLTRRMERQNIVPECARQIAFSWFPAGEQPKTLLDNMLYYGKVLYAMDIFLPGKPDSLKIGFTASQLQWSIDNESSIWRLFIDKQMLYKSDAYLVNRFIQDGPFTSGLPDGSPARLGRWIGWQIIRSYMANHTDTSLTDLFKIMDSQEILAKSGYKPRR